MSTFIRNLKHQWVRPSRKHRRGVSPAAARKSQLRLEVLENRITPGAFTWTGEGENYYWSNPDNWSGGSVPGEGANLFFPEGAPPIEHLQ
jgi:hypothetical protein